ncbi:glycoside hydrolase family 88/105 protein [Cohnella fermenti]|nr:glycoside hydrolase family 88 protein [Cohnella fermenti]
MLQEGDSLYEAGVTQPSEASRLIAARMLATRPRQPIRLRPYQPQPIRQQTPFGSYEADFAAVWPDCAIGTVGYAAAILPAAHEQDVVITTTGTIKLWLNGQAVRTHLEPGPSDEPVHTNCRMREGDNEMIIKCVHNGSRFGFSVNVAFPRYPMMWAKDYLFSTRPTFPQNRLRGEEGFAYLGPFEPPAGTTTGDIDSLANRLDTPLPPEQRGWNFDLTIAYRDRLLSWSPGKPAIEADRPRADLAALYKDAKPNDCAYGVTYIEPTGDNKLHLSIAHRGALNIRLDGAEIYRSEQSGQYTLPIGSSSRRRELLVQSVRGESPDWEFTVEVRDERGERLETIPWLETNRGDAARWLYIGPFAPEEAGESLEVRYDRPYSIGPARSVFWSLGDGETWARPYRDGYFYGQWMYAIQVGLYGLLEAAEAARNEEQRSYVLDSMGEMAKYYRYALWDREQYGVSSLIPRALELNELDPCGLPGMMLIECFNRTQLAEIVPLVDVIAQAVMNGIPRFADGTFHRKSTMWADDLFMSTPLLVRLGRLKGDTRYLDEAIRQAAGYRERLQMPNKGLFAHIYFPDQQMRNDVPWGRGNGWIAFALTEILLHLPEAYPGTEMILGLLNELLTAVVNVQNATGMWHQVLDEPQSYEETSCTAIFVLSLARGVRHGWLAPELAEHARRGWRALLERCVDRDGNVYGVCLGSGCSMDRRYYFDIPTHMNDDHGTGIVLLAAVELERMEQSLAGE